jgi:solute carrier family 25 citrate transporter 1
MAFVGKKDSGVKSVVKGFATGGTMVVMSYPLEYIKTQMQLQSKANPQYTSMADCATKTVAQHGFKGLYRGASVRIVGAGCQQMCRWGAYTNIAAMFRDENGKLSVVGNTISGMGAGVTEAIIAVTPVETIKTRVNDDQRRGTGQYKGSGDAVVKILRSEGPLGLYRGAIPTILKQGTNQAVRMPLQVQFFQIISMGDDSKKGSPLYNGVAGALAGVGSVFLTQPQDCVKSRMQGEEAKKLYSGTLDCAKKMLANEGPTAFFAGGVPRSIQMAANVGLTFAIYPAINMLLEKLGM